LCSKDKSRAHITQPYFDRDAGKLIATNGAAMAIVPVEAEDTDTSGYVPIPAIVAARKAKTGIELNGSARVPAAGLTLDRLDMQFPDWKLILAGVKSNDEEVYTVCLNAELLAQLVAEIKKVSHAVELGGGHAEDGVLKQFLSHACLSPTQPWNQPNP
jgi:hypothetical protein